jgi:hypothetical protein
MDLCSFKLTFSSTAFTAALEVLLARRSKPRKDKERIVKPRLEEEMLDIVSSNNNNSAYD